MSEHLGKTSFLDTPDVNGSSVITAASLQAALTNVVIPGTEGFVVPSGTTAQRPATPTVGEHRYNTSLVEPEVYTNGTWLPYARVIQTASGTIVNATYSTPNKTTVNATVTTSDRGAQIWTATFTPLVVGSRLVVQYTLGAYHNNTTARALFTTVWVANSSVIGGALIGAVPQGTGTIGVGSVNLAVQAVYTTVGTSAITIAAYLGHIHGTSSTVTLGVNRAAGGTLGSALETEWRILEII